MFDRNAMSDLLFVEEVFSKFLKHFRQAFVKI